MGLYVLFFTEMWERFCYYGMLAILVFYMTKHLYVDDHVVGVLGHDAFKRSIEAVFGPQDAQQLSSQVYGLYTAFTYLTPVFGGIVADRWLGQSKSVVVGGVLMAIGEFLLCWDQLFYVGLLVLIIGNGAFKPNISTQVGDLYPPGDPRRDRAFSIFYVGINIGAMLAPFVCGTLGESPNWGWHWGFGSAGVGMILGLIIYQAGQKYLRPEVLFLQTTQATGASGSGRPHAPAFSRSEWGGIIALSVLCALNIPFWGVYGQQGNTLALWMDEFTDRHVLSWMGSSWEMPASWLQSFNPIFIFAFTPVVLLVWRWQDSRRREPTSTMKMAIGSFLLAVSFLIMIGAARIVAGGRLAGVGWLAWSTLLLTLGELYLSPIGLSLVTRVAPPRIVSMMMGIWLGSSFFGNYLSGLLGIFWDKWSKETYFIVMAGLAAVTGILFLTMLRPLNRALGEGKPSAPAT